MRFPRRGEVVERMTREEPLFGGRGPFAGFGGLVAVDRINDLADQGLGDGHATGRGDADVFDGGDAGAMSLAETVMSYTCGSPACT